MHRLRSHPLLLLHLPRFHHKKLKIRTAFHVSSTTRELHYLIHARATHSDAQCASPCSTRTTKWCPPMPLASPTSPKSIKLLITAANRVDNSFARMICPDSTPAFSAIFSSLLKKCSSLIFQPKVAINLLKNVNVFPKLSKKRR